MLASTLLAYIMKIKAHYCLLTTADPSPNFDVTTLRSI